MHLHAARSGEALEAALALEGLDAGVRFHVCGECALHRKGSVALFTLERLLMGVDANMPDKVARFFELFGTVWTAVPANTIFLADGAWHLYRFLEDTPFLLSYFLKYFLV